MRTALVLVIIFNKLTIFSQPNILVNAKKDFGVSLNPELNNLIVANLVGKEVVVPKIGFSAGLNIAFHLTKNISFKTGVGYGLKQYNHTHSGLIFSTDIDPQTGMTSESKIESKITYSELQLPLILQYEWIDKKFFLAGGIELVSPFANRSKRFVYYGNGTVEKLSNGNILPLIIAPTLSFGYVLPINEQVRLCLEPMFKYYLKDYAISASHLYNLGLRTTLRF